MSVASHDPAEVARRIHGEGSGVTARAKRALIPGDVVASARPRSATEAAVLESLVPGEQYSAADVAARVGVSRATAQRYLSALADDGAVDIQLRYGPTGRPEHRYGIPAGTGH